MTRPSQNAGKLSSSIRIFSTHMVTWRVFTNPWESMTKRSRNTQNPQQMAGETPARLAELRKAFRQVGIKVYWRKQLELEEEQPGGTSDPYEVASLYCRLGETNQALEWLQKAYKERSPRMEELKEEPAFDNLRSDPRFGDFLRRVGLLQR